MVSIKKDIIFGLRSLAKNWSNIYPNRAVGVRRSQKVTAIIFIDCFFVFWFKYKPTRQLHIKDICQVEHARRSSGINFLPNVISASIAYS